MNDSNHNIKQIMKKLRCAQSIMLEVAKISRISQYTTRHNDCDQQQIDLLASEIKQNGFHPGRAFHVNHDSSADTFSLITGVSLFAAVKQLSFASVPCFIYEDLTPEEQVQLDAWDNAIDELHKPYHFLQEGEHYRFLHQLGWSIQKIATLKGKSKTSIHRKISIARLPAEVKEIVRKSLRYPLTIFEERNFRLICQLKDKAMILEVCKQIYEIGVKAVKGKGTKLKNKQISELIDAIQTRKELKIPVPPNLENRKEEKTEYFQPNLDFDLKQFAGRGSCTLPAWILDLLIHPGISRDERDLISYIARETFGQQRSVPEDVINIHNMTLIHVKTIPQVINSLIAKGIIVKSDNHLVIRDIDNQQSQPDPTFPSVTTPSLPEEPEIDEGEQIELDLIKAGIEKKNIRICKQIVLLNGGMEYLKAQIAYCEAKKKKGTNVRPGYVVSSIRENYAAYTKTLQNKPVQKRKERSSEDSAHLLKNKYHDYISSAVARETGKMSKDEIISLQEKLIAEAQKNGSTILNHFERDSLTAILMKAKANEPDRMQTMVYKDIMNKLYVDHFQLLSFAEWRQTEEAGAAAER